MIFYGTNKPLTKWRKIVTEYSNKLATEIITVDDRDQFSIDLSTEERDYLQYNFWYHRDPDAPLDINNKPMPWNWIIGFTN